MPYAQDPLLLLKDPIFILAGVVLLLVIYRFSSLHRARQRKRRASLRVRARHAENPRERRELMLQWNEMGGLRDHKRARQSRSAREQGQKARAAGRPLSANPYRHSLWGDGRLWKLGWRSVDRNIRWIERRR